MNARRYRIDLNLSPVDFPPITGLGESTVYYLSEPVMIRNKVLLMIAKTYVLIDMNTNEQHSVLTAQSIYEIPPAELKCREDVYEFYKDALSGLNEAYQDAQTQMPDLPPRIFTSEPIEHYTREIDRVFDLLNRQN